jgi:DNA polymerase III epsilon subunit family exonuclease
MPFSLIQPLSTIPIACIDVETTGASADIGDRIIEVGIVRYEGGQKIAEYEQLVDPKRRISAGVTALTGISQSMCAGRPTFAEQLAPMLKLLGGAAILGHNIRFDLSFLIREFQRAGHPMQEMFPAVPVLDTVRIARRRFGRGGNGLGNLARRLGHEPQIAHRALPDAQTTAIVFEQLLIPIGGWQTMLCDILRDQGGPMPLIPQTQRQPALPLELEEALESGRPVLMDYLDAGDRRTQRVVQPLQIRNFRGELVLIAHCHLRNDRRNFKIERIVSLSRVESPQAGNAATGHASSGLV